MNKENRTKRLFSKQGDYFGENTYVILDFIEKNEEMEDLKVTLIDPGVKDIKWLIDLNEATKFSSIKILLTHVHVDHIVGIDNIKRAFPDTLVVAPKFEAQRINDRSYTLARFNVETKIDIEVLEEKMKDIKVGDREELIIDGTPITYLSTPGHTKGSSTIVYDDFYVFTGDTLFKNGYGRCDLKTGSVDDMNKSLKFLFSTFRDDIEFYPGHGEVSTFGEEKEYYDLIY